MFSKFQAIRKVVESETDSRHGPCTLSHYANARFPRWSSFAEPSFALPFRARLDSPADSSREARRKLARRKTNDASPLPFSPGLSNSSAGVDRAEFPAGFSRAATTDRLTTSRSQSALFSFRFGGNRLFESMEIFATESVPRARQKIHGNPSRRDV